MTVVNEAGYSYNAHYHLERQPDGQPYLITAFNLPTGSMLVLHGAGENGVRVREEVTETPTTLKLSLSRPEIFVECKPHPFPIHLAEGVRQNRLVAASQ